MKDEVVGRVVQFVNTKVWADMRTRAGTWSGLGRACQLQFQLWNCLIVSLMILMMGYYCHGQRVIDPHGLTFHSSNTSALNGESSINGKLE